MPLRKSVQQIRPKAKSSACNNRLSMGAPRLIQVIDMPLEQLSDKSAEAADVKSLFEILQNDIESEDSTVVRVSDESKVFGDLVLKTKHSLVSDNQLSLSSALAKDAPFNGYDNALQINHDRNGFSIEDREVVENLLSHRVIDIVFFSQGALTSVDKQKVQTHHDKENKDQPMFLVPKNTKIFDYNPKEEDTNTKA